MSQSKKSQKKYLGFYETDASRIKGSTNNVVFPKSIEEVQKMVQENGLIVPRGGGTGLRGGAVPKNTEVVLDTSKLSNWGKINTSKKELEVESGVVLGDLQEYLQEKGLEFPLNPLSKDSCTLGGMVATNAFGPWAQKYGFITSWIKWVEIVDSKGNLQRKGITEISDYVGKEGITGIVVKLCIKVIPLQRRTASLLTFKDPFELVEAVKNLKREQDVCSLEFFDTWITEKFNLKEGYTLLVEYEGEKGELKGSEYENIMILQEKAYLETQKEGYLRIEDPKILLDKFSTFLQWCEERKIPVFGSIGLGIIHPCLNHEQEISIPAMITFVKRLGGKNSGKYGIGILKKEFVEFIDKSILLNIKKRCDPENKFNVGKII